MADVAVHDSPAPTGSPPRDPDARPSSSGSTAQSGAIEHPVQTPVVSEELKGRLDKVIYSDVRPAPRVALMAMTDNGAQFYRSVLQPS